MYIAAVGGEEFLLLCEVGTVAGDDTLAVEHEDVLTAGTESYVELGARDCRSTCTIDYNLYLLNFLACNL